MLQCDYFKSLNDFNLLINNNMDENDQEIKRLISNSLIKLTALNLQYNQDEEAFNNYEKAITIDPLNEDIYCNRAQVLAMKSKFNESFQDFNRALEINPKHKLAKLQHDFFKYRQLFQEIQLKVQLNTNLLTRDDELNLEKETSSLEIKVNNEFSDMPEAYSLYAQILSEQGLYTKANDYYSKAIKLEPLNSSLKVQRALNTMQMLNSFDDAIIQLEQVINDDDTCEFAYETLATIEIQRGNLERAAYLFDKAIDLSRNEESMINLCSMLIGAKTQFKIFHKYSSQLQSTALNYFNL